MTYEIRKRVNDTSFLIGIKLNSVEFQEGGFTPQECRDLCVELEKHGIDFVELSGGTYQELAFSHKRESTKKREAFFIEFAEMIVPELKKTKVYVTGGLRTAAAMVEALKTVHGIGLARPVTHEFDLAKKLIDGTVKSALNYTIDEQDFGLTNIAAGTQYVLFRFRHSLPAAIRDLARAISMHLGKLTFVLCTRIRLVGKGKEPLDLGRPDHKEAFDKALQQFQNDMANNVDGSKYGYMDIDGVRLEPYGTPYGAVPN
ncbi:hypothetical protein E0Z10_g3757 [Xylaria hypoxylon]|uniref:NADH:flavin oxidoreductase/NADH oxidase N-terminal domain-containing protein n=1 Tax=Xylaria hypoxylon TaxID=37992 RepID=A0A4Z0Z8W5_9PEZI|nr:hypothetical protein E0Z10_g3757 [Xylaria hypoxylon]